MKISDRRIIHGLSKTKEYRAWWGMLQRCYNPHNAKYSNYGGRNIKVCDRWKNFTNFYVDMGKKPSLDHSLDRRNNDGDYSPSNCRWATRSQQQMNKRQSFKKRRRSLDAQG